MPIDSQGLFYFDSAQEKGGTRATDLPAVIFLHAFPLDHRMWAEQVEALRGTYRVIAPDLRGQGQNPVDPHLLIDFFVDDLFRLQDELGLNAAAYCGLSMGGYVALRAVEREPRRCRALVLCDTRAEGDSTQAKIKRAESTRFIRRAGVDAFLEQFFLNAMCAPTFERNPALVNRVREIARSAGPERIISALIALAARTDTSETLSLIRVPTLIMVGALDVLTTVQEALQMGAKIGSSELKVIEKAGHYSNLENPGQFNLELKGFLDKTLI